MGELSLISALPREVHEMDQERPIFKFFAKIFGELMARRVYKSVQAMRNVLTFLFGFLFADNEHSLVNASDTESDELLERVLAVQTEDSLVRAYQKYHTMSKRSKNRHSLSISTLTRQINLITLLFNDILRIKAVPRFIDICRFNKPNVAPETFSSCNLNKVKYRHYFNADEVRALYLACQTPIEKLMMTALFTTGMRRQAFCRVETKGTLNGMTVGNYWCTQEKYNQHVEYEMAPVLRTLLQQWVDTKITVTGEYLFASRKRGANNMFVTPQNIYRIFMSVARRAGVTGKHCHPHTTRHTVAWTLAALGNSVEDIAIFMGHKNPQVTRDIYIAMSRSQTMSRMNCPWIKASSDECGIKLQNLGYELASALASPFASEDQKTFPCFQSSPGNSAIKTSLKRHRLLNEVSDILEFNRKLKKCIGTLGKCVF